METFENLNDTTYLADIGCRFKLVNDLIPYARNSRDHSDGQVSKIASSIKEFKFLNPVIIDGDNGIIAGHGRVLAAKKINMTYVPVVDGSHLSKLQRRAYVIADNKIALDSTWDDELLKIELKDLKLADFDLDLTGFDLPEIEELFAGDEDNEIKEGLIDDDEVPDVDKNEYGVKRGDVWVLGQHRLKCGDSTNEDDVAYLMQGEKADMVFTDPPYNQETEGGFKSEIGQAFGKQSADIEHLCNFEPEKTLEIIPDLFNKNTLNCFLFCNKDLVPNYLNWAQQKRYSFNILVWKKPSGIPIGGSYTPDIEYMLVFRKSAIFNRVENVIYSKVMIYGRETGLHPTMKPIDLITNQLQIASNKNSLVVDLFLGSGSTLIACEKTGRRCYGMELDEHYCSVIIKRWEEFTGEKAVLEKNDDFSESLKGET